MDKMFTDIVQQYTFNDMTDNTDTFLKYAPNKGFIAWKMQT